MIAINDNTLQQELDVLNIALSYAPDPLPEVSKENSAESKTTEEINDNNNNNNNNNNDKRKIDNDSLNSIDSEISEKKPKLDQPVDESNVCVICLHNSKSTLLLPCK